MGNPAALRGIAPSAPRMRGLVAGLVPGCGPEALDRIVRATSLRHVRRGEMLMREGEIAATLGKVVEGTLGMVQAMPQGTPHVLGLLLPGDVFGRVFDGPIPHSVEALTDASVLWIDREIFEDTLRETPAAERALIVSMMDELDAARAWVLILNSPRASGRVAAFLAVLVRRLQPHGLAWPTGPVTLRLPMARKDLARSLGLRPESLSRAIHRLVRAGVVEIVSSAILHVPDPDALIEHAGQDSDAADRPARKSAAMAGGRVA